MRVWTIIWIYIFSSDQAKKGYWTERRVMAKFTNHNRYYFNHIELKQVTDSE